MNKDTDTKEPVYLDPEVVRRLREIERRVVEEKERQDAPVTIRWVKRKSE